MCVPETEHHVKSKQTNRTTSLLFYSHLRQVYCKKLQYTFPFLMLRAKEGDLRTELRLHATFHFESDLRTLTHKAYFCFLLYHQKVNISKALQC